MTISDTPTETCPVRIARPNVVTLQNVGWLVYLACPALGGVTVASWAGIWAGIAVHVVLAAALTTAIGMIRFAERHTDDEPEHWHAEKGSS
jgi:hypothetical protein